MLNVDLPIQYKIGAIKNKKVAGRRWANASYFHYWLAIQDGLGEFLLPPFKKGKKVYKKG